MKPLDVECPKCAAHPGYCCTIFPGDDTSGWPQIAPHAARVRAAEQKEKEGKR